MSEQLGTLEELLQDYRDAMSAAGVAPLWPMMRNGLPHGAPKPVTAGILGLSRLAAIAAARR
ncbi:MAG: hypothetical protein R3D29_08950 [Nitratireductor sp.]